MRTKAIDIKEIPAALEAKIQTLKTSFGFCTVGRLQGASKECQEVKNVIQKSMGAGGAVSPCTLYKVCRTPESITTENQRTVGIGATLRIIKWLGYNAITDKSPPLIIEEEVLTKEKVLKKL